MTVYLIHFDRPYKHARHYLGSAKDLNARLAEHRSGHGARLIQVIQEAGITWRVARTWEGGRLLEYYLKARKNSPHLCPLCWQTEFVHRHFDSREGKKHG